MATLAAQGILTAPGVLGRSDRRAADSDFALSTRTTGIRQIRESRRVLTGSVHARARRDASLCCLARALTAGFTATPSDRRHVLPIPAHGHSTFPAGRPCFARIEFVRRTFRMSGASALAGDFLLLRLVHRREATRTLASAVPASRCATTRNGDRRDGTVSRLVDDIALALTIRRPEAAVVVACSIRHYYSLP